MKSARINGSGGRWGLGYLLGIPFAARRARGPMENMIDRRFGWLVRHAAETMPFYRELLDAAGVDPASVSCTRDIVRLPLVGHQALREAGDRAWATDLAPGRRMLATTSGSSDEPLTLVFRFQDRLRKHLVSLHCMSMYGWRPWHRGMALGSQALPVGHGLERFGISRWAWMDTSRPVEEWLTEYDRVRPQALHAYPSALREFCFQARERGPLEWLPDVLSVGGELCPDELAPLAREVFGKAPLTMYGAVEGGRIAFECEAHRGLHVRADSVHIEILRNGEPAKPGEEGSVYMTSLINTAMPIIRYELGDVAAWEEGDCPCGLWWPRLRMRQGRTGDVIPLPGGRHVPVTHLSAIVGHSHRVRQFQFVGKQPGVLVLRFEPLHEGDRPEEAVMESLRKTLPGVELRVEPTGALPRTRSGKVRRFIDEHSGTGALKGEDS